ncbi:cupin domain-containing protein [bacterium]|nr:cupin domain-containing protein [bacterium]
MPKIFAILSITLTACAGQPAEEHLQQATRQVAEETPVEADHFTGKIYHKSMVEADSTYTTLVGKVYFEAGARSFWHSHPAGQLLLVTDGIGYHQIAGKPLEILHKGDVVKCPPNTLHWHGASKNAAMQHIYIIPNTEKGVVEWKQEVTEDEYNKTTIN